jgi:hypothetical protein
VRALADALALYQYAALRNMAFKSSVTTIGGANSGGYFSIVTAITAPMNLRA